MLPPGERITVGLVRGVHGLRGTIRVEVLSDTPGRFDPGRILFVEGSEDGLTVAWSQPSKPGLLLRFEELASRESVEPLRDRYLETIPDAALPPDTWYWHQIHGLEVCTSSGEALGTVSDVFRAGEGEVYVVRGGPRGELLVPAVRSVVSELAPDRGCITVDAVALALPDEPPSPTRGEEPPLPGQGEGEVSGEGAGEAAGDDAGETAGDARAVT